MATSSDVFNKLEQLREEVSTKEKIVSDLNSCMNEIQKVLEKKKAVGNSRKRTNERTSWLL